MHRYFIIYKPFKVISQFTSELNKQTLANFFDLPKDVYPVGRLDEDSEGLLILTNDNQLNHRLLNPMFLHEREYWAQVEGVPSAQAISQLQSGVTITVNDKPYKTKKCQAIVFAGEPEVPLRNPSIRFRKDIPTAWLKLILTEGKNRQVRKMTAKVGYPTLRLIRYSIEAVNIEGMQPGDIAELTRDDMYSKLFHHKQ